MFVNSMRRPLVLLAALVAVSTLAGCQFLIPAPTATPTPSPTFSPTPAPSPTPTPTPEPTPTLSPTPEPTPVTVTMTLGAVGDIMCHQRQLTDAAETAKKTGGEEPYAFDHWFTDIAPALQTADILIGNLETTLSGDAVPYQGYPQFNTPDQILSALLNAGFDVLTTANNHILDHGVDGMLRTLTQLDAAGIAHTGSWATREDRAKPLIVSYEDIRVGVVSATYGINRDGFISGDLSYMVAIADEEQVIEMIRAAKDAGADVVALSLHWGYEYATTPSSQIRKLAAKYIAAGADVIFGHHPHVINPVEWITAETGDGTEREGLVFWSLGNFISNQPRKTQEDGTILYRDLGLIAYVDIEKNRATGQITLKNARYLPTCVVQAATSYNRYRVLPIGAALDDPSLTDMTFSASYFKTLWNYAVRHMGTDAASPIRGVAGAQEASGATAAPSPSPTSSPFPWEDPATAAT